jgi:transposase
MEIQHGKEDREKMDELLTMSKKELTRLEVMQRLEEKRMRQKEAAEILGISTRHIRRLLHSYREHREKGLISKRRGKPSNNRLKAETKQQAIDLLYSRYHDFGPTLAHEKLTEVHEVTLSVESVRQIMIAEALWKPRKVKRKAVHQMRPRRACLGELVQIDGSPHAWFEDRGPACTLLVYIDDATGKLMELLFVPVESTFNYFAATRRYLDRHGRPVAFYSDKNGIFKVNAKNALSGSGMTQFGQAMKTLDIEIICANTPQAKGRVERVNQTLQDRLVKELRLNDISSMGTANVYVPVFIADFNRRFAVQPRSSHDAHRPLLFSEDELDIIFSHKETRVLSKNLTLQYNRVIYQIQTTRPTYALRHAKVTVCENAQGLITILYKGRPLNYTIFHKQHRQAQVVMTKEIDTHLKKPKKPHKPGPDHPWRQYGRRINGKPISEKAV